MSSSNYDQFDHLEEINELGVPQGASRVRNLPKKQPRPRRKDLYNKISEPETAHAIYAQRDDLRFLNFTYQASRTERGWLIDSLGGFYEQHWFDDVLQIVKGGKEASVYQCRGNAASGAEFVAAKVFRPRMFRSLKNDALYRQGRAMLDSDGLIIKEEGMLKAIGQRSDYGLDLTHVSWIEHEARALRRLHAAGADVPQVYASGDNALLMSYVGDAQLAAPTLIAVRLEPHLAAVLFDRVLQNIDLMLGLRIVHGDLSAYNILYWEEQITLIDFPQVVDPYNNPDAFMIFARDVRRVCEYFARQGVRADPVQLAEDLWLAHRLPREEPLPEE